MIYGDLQFFDILIFAAIAGFIIYRLRSVLGKRTGFQKNISEPKPQETKKQEDVQKIPSLMDNETKLEAVYKKVNNFNHREFLDGAKKAFEIIISSFNNGDKKTLKNLVSKDVYSAFEKAIDEKNTQIYNKNKTKTKIIEVNKEDYLAHKEMLKKLKNPLWKKFNY